jgi:hypothetical protein
VPLEQIGHSAKSRLWRQKVGTAAQTSRLAPGSHLRYESSEAMLSFRVSLAVAALAAATAAPSAHAPGPAPCTGSDPDYAWTMDTLRDVVSFSDQLSVIRVVREAIPPAPKGPEGWAGLIGRTVTVEVERTLWRRPGAASAPARFRFSDSGWWGDLGHKRPTRIPGVTRLRVGHRYLAAIARWHGTWLAHEQVRLSLKGRLVVGGVDCGEPSFAHQELAGRRIKDAVAVVTGTAPYRAAARHPGLNPARRWQVVDRDRYRVEGKARNEPITVQAGVTAQSRWTLYTRRGRHGGWCLGLGTRPLWPGGGFSPSGEGCGGPGVTKARPITLGAFSAAGRGAFVYGHAWEGVTEVEVTVGDSAPVTVQTMYAPREIGGRNRYWVAPTGRDLCDGFSVKAVGFGAPSQVLRASPGCPQPFSRIFTSAR